MIQHYELKDYPYEERRKEFFKQKRLEAKRRMDHWAKRVVYGCYNRKKKKKGEFIAMSEETENQTITLEQFKNALENNTECKGYFDSLCDKTVNTRLDKGIESWKEKNLNNLIETEINKRYPQKTETELKFEEQQKQLEQIQAEKQQLQLQIKYHDLMAENN